jgi:hypothetical protein
MPHGFMERREFTDAYTAAVRRAPRQCDAATGTHAARG